MYRDVREFSEKFGLGLDQSPSGALVDERLARVREEAREYLAALRYLRDAVEGPLADPNHVARALDDLALETADLVYVLLGGMARFGVDFPAVWAEVHRANMDKVADPAGGKPKKPPGWRPPDGSAGRKP